jgi:hypothetical protein
MIQNQVILTFRHYVAAVKNSNRNSTPLESGASAIKHYAGERRYSEGETPNCFLKDFEK